MNIYYNFQKRKEICKECCKNEINDIKNLENIRYQLLFLKNQAIDKNIKSIESTLRCNYKKYMKYTYIRPNISYHCYICNQKVINTGETFMMQIVKNSDEKGENNFRYACLDCAKIKYIIEPTGNLHKYFRNVFCELGTFDLYILLQKQGSLCTV